MNCRAAMRRLADQGAHSGSDAELDRHLASCAACREIFAGLTTASAVPDPAHLAAIQKQLEQRWKPVRPLPSPRTQTIWLGSLFLAIALVSAARIGFYSLRALAPLQMLLYFGALALAAALVAGVVVQRLYPGARARYDGTRLEWLVVGTLALLMVLLFPNFRVDHFASGVPCLEAGCWVAGTAAVVFALALRRTFASTPVAASTTVGLFSGLCGASALALHCPVLTTPHILVWHFGVLLIATAAGAVFGWLSTFRNVS